MTAKEPSDAAQPLTAEKKAMKATARRSGEWWAVEVNGEEYHSQAKRLDQVPEMAADVVALLTGQPAGSVEVTVVPILADA